MHYVSNQSDQLGQILVCHKMPSNNDNTLSLRLISPNGRVPTIQLSDSMKTASRTRSYVGLAREITS